MNQQSFFNRISQVALNELTEFLAHNQTEIILKIQNQYVRTNITAKKSDKNFAIPLFSAHHFTNEQVTCSFQVNEEIYFFKSYLNSAQNDYSLEIPENGFFQLQRRNNYRVSIPVGLIYNCHIKSINGVSCNIKTEIRDLSLGGCQLSITHNGADELLKQNDEIAIYLKLDRFEFNQLVLTTKHIKEVEPKKSVLVGCSFEELNAALLAELQALLMFLDRLHRGKEL